ncbi:MAG: zinc metallopeptidase [Oscillospiraceae bacterium]|jgi:Zn-dependent membrane protease YugP|nr:zinc metallopeptidase [Oscillospiraceae bacterium]
MPYGFGYGFNMTYIVLVLPAVILAIFASARVKSTFKKYSQSRTASGITGAEAAERILRSNGLYNVRVEMVSGTLSDHYDPKENVISLSQAVYGNASTAAVGVAAHEAGHALQYAGDYGPIKLRGAIIPMTQIGSRAAIPLVIIGLLLSGFSAFFINFAYAGIICFALCVVFQLVTLPVEFNASRRAMQTINQYGILTADEQKEARRVLSAAAMTYVAALAVSLTQLLRLLLLVSGRRRN